MASAPVPPNDWNDVAGWDAYHAADSPSRSLDSLGVSVGLQYIRGFRERGVRRIWLPGCGRSFGPRAFAELGFDVLATDISPVAVAFQAETKAAELADLPLARLFEQQAQRSEPVDRRPGTLVVRLHDFQEPLGEGELDVVLNVCAFQGFDRERMRRIARVHAEAVRRGGWAIFETMNVQGEARDHIEEALTDAGLVVPLHRSERAYRAALAATGVPFVFIVGRPVPLSLKPEDRATLDALANDYRAHQEQEARETRQLLEDPSTKMAFVVYSTG